MTSPAATLTRVRALIDQDRPGPAAQIFLGLPDDRVRGRYALARDMFAALDARGATAQARTVALDMAHRLPKGLTPAMIARLAEWNMAEAAARAAAALLATPVPLPDRDLFHLAQLAVAAGHADSIATLLLARRPTNLTPAHWLKTLAARASAIGDTAAARSLARAASGNGPSGPARQGQLP